jgi:tetratricopeptide (TPR) repeat protein
VRCGIPLQGYKRLLLYPSQLFNIALTEARQGQLGKARDLFASLVQWCPLDIEARNALAMACLALGDKVEARSQWEIVLAQSPNDPLAQRGLKSCSTIVVAKQHIKKQLKKKVQYKKGHKRRHS